LERGFTTYIKNIWTIGRAEKMTRTSGNWSGEEAAPSS
jgi:hypothetical protein